MVASNKEENAIVQFLENLYEQREKRKRLFQRASEEPELVIAYLNSLPEGVEQQDQDGLLQKLRSIATAAIDGRIDLIE